ncbi:RIC1-domain-containing protein [Punctularia strigosozonata HHB-11173 SS5]|uniref:RIC1-domain-containing protein n=1 Tax=Punctularia strigosozonata (strain HHB-11173) TaxID=741275 RepID=UPI0004416946|nr:RIC1-domain-containing protein [Punctularia strigosozonata HHB-11173 SS5]EIN13398.1 RIC1-domain-containing protein [Punctularia strigosozonata HHB-11173 SS5]
MYFPTAAARQLCTVPALPLLEPEPVLCIRPNARRNLFCSLTRSGLTVWRVRPSAVLSYLSRTPTSLAEHGENASAHWSPDGKRIIIQTNASFLVLVAVDYDPNETPYKAPPLAPNAQRNFLAGPGESLPLQAVTLRFEGVIRIEGTLRSVSPRKHYILFSTQDPPAVQRIPWPDIGDESNSAKKSDWVGYDTWVLNDHELPWLVDANVTIADIGYSRAMGVDTWITSDGRGYIAQLIDSSLSPPSATDLGTVDEEAHQRFEGKLPKASMDSTASQTTLQWQGICIHNFDPPRWVGKRRQVDADSSDSSDSGYYDEPRRAVAIAVNGKFSVIAIGTHGGAVHLSNLPSEEGAVPRSDTLQIPASHLSKKTGPVRVMEWSSDGYVLAVGWQYGWAVWSVGGRCLAWGFGTVDEVDEDRFQDAFMHGVRDLFWAPGNFELFVLAQSSPNTEDGQLFVIPFAKSAATSQHSPARLQHLDNTRYAFLQLDDRMLVYRGADQPDMSVINPESDVPHDYIAANWPIRYSALSTDGRLIAVAGRRGLIHYSSNSGRWKLFADEMQEQAFSVRGGLVWFHHVLIAAVEVSRSYQVRLYSRDLELSNKNVLHREILSSPVVILSLVDNSLLVYTADNTLLHYLIIPTPDSIKLHLCGSITFEGVIANPNAVRVLSWMIPSAQKQLGDPADDMSVATVLMMVGGKLVLLKPRRSGDQEVKYDMQILADRIEFCWIHLRGIRALENSLWGYDGQGVRVWLNALAIEAPPADDASEPQDSVKESVNMPLDFYPLSALMDKGIIIGVEHEVVTRSNLPFVMFRHATSSHLFLHHILLFHLEAGQVREAVQFAAEYANLVYFAHALEMLLHDVVESEFDSANSTANGTIDGEAAGDGVLPTVVEFLDHFDEALDVIVKCARKTEVTRWPRLFDIVGSPQALFETCLETGRLTTAGSYLLVLHTLEQLEGNARDDAARLLRSAQEAGEWKLCRELMRFLRSVDESGNLLREACEKAGILDSARPADDQGQSVEQTEAKVDNVSVSVSS